MNRYSDMSEITSMTGNELGIFDIIICDEGKVSSVTEFWGIIEKVDKCKTSGVICELASVYACHPPICKVWQFNCH